jgi:[ribosomal protein S5]-alanine N-acetyltransferase
MDTTDPTVHSDHAAPSQPSGTRERAGRTAVVDFRIEPVRAEWIEALVESDGAFSERFGMPVVPGWVGFPEALPYALEAARSKDCDPWGSYLFFDDDGALVGFGGFKGAPVDGIVEIGYAIAPPRQGRGAATQAVEAMVSRARDAGVDVVIAHTLAELSASTTVLARCHFAMVATVADPDGGVTEGVWRWERSLR